MDIIIYLAVTLTAFMLGAQALRVLRLAPDEPAERGLAALVLGHVLLGLGILGLGLVGYLRWWALAHLLLLSALAGLRSLDDCLSGIAELAVSASRALGRSPYRLAFIALAVIIVLQLFAALAPPTPSDWDATSEHLAEAKQYARDGRVHPLWYDHHSQFPATLQMFYTLAHVLGVPGAAKLFHWGFGVMALGAVALAGRRLLAPAAGAYGALILATTPVFARLMGVGYVDLPAIACGVLAVHFFARWLRDDELRCLWLSALMAGAGASFKMQGLALLGVLVVGVVVARRSRLEGLRLAAISAAIALAVCAPWYVKTWVLTGNPVYPFAYDLFGGRYWSAENAAQYRYSQRSFGRGELPPYGRFRAMTPLQRTFAGPRRPLNMLLAPLYVTIEPTAYTDPLAPLGVFATDSIGPMWLALLPLLALLRRPPPVRWMLWILLALGLWWVWSMQYARYLMATLALVAPAAGWVVVEAERGRELLRWTVRWALALWTAVAIALMALYVVPQVPAGLGLVDAHTYLSGSPLYEMSEFINDTTPPEAKIALYGEPRGYYLDRDYLWADPGHSGLIRYHEISDADDLVAEWRRLGVTHVVINALAFPDIHGGGDPLAHLIGEAQDEGLLTQLAPPPAARSYLVFRLAQP